MKVTRNTPDQLILGDTPWQTAIGISIFVLILLGAGMMLWQNAPVLAVFFYVIGVLVGFIGFVVFVNRVQVILMRPENRILIQRRSVFGHSATEHDLSKLAGAVTEEKESIGDRGPRILYRPTLVMRENDKETRIPVVETYSNEAGVHVLVDAINAWLPAQSLDFGPPPD